VNIHASCVLLDRAGEAFGAPADAGVLLLGDSGVGKSDLALRLIERGATLVADDRTELFVEDGALFARAPTSLAGLLEVRGVGILELPHAKKARIALAVRIVGSSEIVRLPEPAYYDPPEGLVMTAALRPPLLHLAPFEISAPAKIVAAAAAHAKALFRDGRKPL
jgi:serine kinase of HPr protein (carbohydrate metabolism regulator)